MRLDRVGYARRLAVPLRDIGADGGVAALYLVVDGFADVVQQPRAPHDRHVGADFGRDHCA